jgi:hypothetical protein
LFARVLVVDPDVGQRHRAQLQAAVEQPVRGEMVHHQPAKAVHAAFLDGDQHLVLAGQALDQLGVERLGEAGIGHGGGKTIGRQFVGGLQAFLQPRAIGQDGDLGALAQHAAAARSQHGAARRQRLDAQPSPRGSARPMGRHLSWPWCDHVRQLDLVGGCHQREAGRQPR